MVHVSSVDEEVLMWVTIGGLGCAYVSCEFDKGCVYFDVEELL